MPAIDLSFAGMARSYICSLPSLRLSRRCCGATDSRRSHVAHYNLHHLPPCLVQPCSGYGLPCGAAPY